MKQLNRSLKAGPVLLTLLLWIGAAAPASAARPPAPQPLAPNEVTTAADGRVTLQWSAVPGAAAYQVAIMGEGGRYRKSKWRGALSRTLKVKIGTAYTWKVRVRTPDGRLSRWSQSLVFFTKEQCVTGVDPASVFVPYDVEYVYLWVNTLKGRPCAWTVSSTGWITPDMIRGEGPVSLELKVSRNNAYGERTGQITVGGVPVQVRQEGSGIRGHWKLWYTYSTTAQTTLYIFEYEGRRSCILGGSQYAGSWNQSGNTLTMHYDINDPYYGKVITDYTGTIKGPDFMVGTMKNSRGQSGTWQALREGAEIVK